MHNRASPPGARRSDAGSAARFGLQQTGDVRTAHRADGSKRSTTPGVAGVTSPQRIKEDRRTDPLRVAPSIPAVANDARDNAARSARGAPPSTRGLPSDRRSTPRPDRPLTGPVFRSGSAALPRRGRSDSARPAAVRYCLGRVSTAPRPARATRASLSHRRQMQQRRLSRALTRKRQRREDCGRRLNTDPPAPVESDPPGAGSGSSGRVRSLA